MKTRSYSLFAVSILLILFRLLAEGRATPVKANQLSTNPEIGQQLDQWIYLPLISGGSAPVNTGGAGSLWLTYLLSDTSLLPTYGSSVAVDNQGGIHIAYSIYSGSDEQGLRPATYAYCAANCADKAS